MTYREQYLSVGGSDNKGIELTVTGGEGSFTQWVHCGYIVSSG